MTRTQKLAMIPLAAALMLGGGAIAGYASLAGAQTTTPTQQARPQRPAAMGTITGISGSSITLSSMGKSGTTTYTVDASSATVTKNGATSTLSSLAVGDRISVEGTLSGTNVTATRIMDGFGGMMGRGPGGFGGRGGPMGQGVQGTVSAVNGTTVTVTAKDGTSYTINASSAKVSKVVDLTVGDIKVGDTVGVEGTVSGTTVTAQHIMDGVPPTPQAPPAH